MTRKLLLTAAIVALALTPSIGTGTAQARGFGGGGFGGGFHGGLGSGFHAAASGAAFTADTVVSIRAITDMAIPRTAITITDDLQPRPETA